MSTKTVGGPLGEGDTGDEQPAPDVSGGTSHFGCLWILAGFAAGAGVVALCWLIGQWSFEAGFALFVAALATAIVLGLTQRHYLLGAGIGLGLCTVVALPLVACFSVDYLGVDKLAQGKLAPQGAKLLSTNRTGVDFLDNEARVVRAYAYDGPPEDVMAFYRAELGRREWQVESERSGGSYWTKGGTHIYVSIVDASDLRPSGFVVTVTRSRPVRQ